MERACCLLAEKDASDAEEGIVFYQRAGNWKQAERENTNWLIAKAHLKYCALSERERGVGK